MPLYHELRRDRRPKGGGWSAGLGGGIFSRITTLFGTAVEAARSSRGIFTSFFIVLFLLLFYEGECPVDAQFLRKCVDSIMKLDQKSKKRVKARAGARAATARATARERVAAWGATRVAERAAAQTAARQHQPKHTTRAAETEAEAEAAAIRRLSDRSQPTGMK